MKIHVLRGHRAAALVVAALVGGLAGCSTSPTHVSYLYRSPGSSVLVQWQASGSGHLTGTVTGAALTGKPPHEDVSSSSAALTGTVSGSSVDLTLTTDISAGSFAPTRRGLLGTLKGGTLTLQIPEPDGTIRQVKLSSGGVTGYNQAVAALHATARTTDSTLMCGQSWAVVGNAACGQSNMTAEPASYALSADGALSLAGLKWSDWGSSSATATGVLKQDNCTPSCYQGSWSSFPVTVTVTSLTQAGSVQYYASMRVSSPTANMDNTYPLAGP